MLVDEWLALFLLDNRKDLLAARIVKMILNEFPFVLESKVFWGQEQSFPASFALVVDVIRVGLIGQVKTIA